MLYRTMNFLKSGSTSVARKLTSTCIGVVAGSAMVFGSLPAAHADYLGSSNLRIFPTPVADSLADGYDIGDQIEFIIEITPSATGSDKGHAAWSTFYVPNGAVVVDTFYAIKNGDGTFSETIAEVVDETYDGCEDGAGDTGDRGCSKAYQANIPGNAGEGVYFNNGRTNEVQQDTGIFYSTDPRTAQIFTGDNLDPTGVDDNMAFNQWDYDQTVAFGENGALSANFGKGNTPIVSTDASSITDNTATWHGTGSPVAGDGTYYTNDYNDQLTLVGTAPNTTLTCPDGSPIVSNGDATIDEFEKYQCVGPWQRIETPGDEFGGATLLVVGPPAIGRNPAGSQADRNIDTNTGSDDIGRTSTDFVGGWNFDLQGPLPDTVNAIRIVHGERKLGDLEHWGLVLEITHVGDFKAALTPTTVGREFSGNGTCLFGITPVDGDTNCDGVFTNADTLICADSIPGDTSDLAAKDSNWRYYEVSRSCVQLSPDAALVKEVVSIDGDTNATVGADGDAVVYQFTFTNIANEDGDLDDELTGVVAIDVGGDRIDLSEPGINGCPAPDPTAYDGLNPDSGDDANYDDNSIGGTGIGTWEQPTGVTLPEGQTLTYTVCGVIDEDDPNACGNMDDAPCAALNEVRIRWAGCPNPIGAGNDQYCLSSTAIVPISNSISGFVYDETGVEIDGAPGDGEVGIEGVIVRLYRDDNGIFDGGEVVEATTVTNSNGFYQFQGIDTGFDYIIVMEDPAGYLNSGDADEESGGVGHCPSTGNDCSTIGANVAADDGTASGYGTGVAADINVVAATKLTNHDFFLYLPGPDLSVVKSDDVALFRVKGQTYTYTLDIANNGTTQATNVTVFDTLPGEVSWVSTTTPTGTCTAAPLDLASCACADPDGPVVECDVGTLAGTGGGAPPGGTAQVTITVSVD